jgi:hypothetical protein
MTFVKVDYKGYWILGVTVSRRLHNSKDQTVFCLDLGNFAWEIFFDESKKTVQT